MSRYPYSQSGRFGPTLESERLPVLGQDRHVGRARAWNRLLIALAGFWLVIMIGLVSAVWL